MSSCQCRGMGCANCLERMGWMGSMGAGESFSENANDLNVGQNSFLAGDIPSSNLSLGSAKIQQIQAQLTSSGFDTQGVDGIWGHNTQNAFLQFQQAANITVDGIYGPESEAALFGSGGATTVIEIDPIGPPPPDPINVVVPQDQPLGDQAPATMSTAAKVALIGGGALLLGGLVFVMSKKKGSR